MEGWILQEGRNCWKIAPASRLKFLIDGASYFSALAEALEEARESILILAWDFDGQIRLKPDHDGSANANPDLRTLLNSLVRRRRELQVHLLVWDFAMFFSLGRNPLPISSGWPAHPRIHLRMDSEHPVGASHHAKIVVVDDVLAFTGGIDLARGRWDTPEHRPEEPLRGTSNGAPLPPHHDIQVAVSGEAAAWLGRLVRERWRCATGESLNAPAAEYDLWPSSLKPDLTDIDIAIARTEPAYKNRPAIREIEALHRDAVAAAKNLIYMENQYLSSISIGEALANRLREENGPEIILVISKKSAGWLEEATLDVLRSRLLKRLRDADRFHRLRVYCPVIDGLQNGCMSVHSKALVVDDRLVRVGSANICNRSMGLDTECDLAIEAKNNKNVEREIGRFRNSLLAEHLGVKPEELEARVAENESLIAAVDSLSGAPARTLEILDGSVPEWLDQMVPDSAVVDPESPIAAEKLIENFVPQEERRSTAGTMLRGAIILALLFGLAAAWRWTSLGQWLDVGAITNWDRLLPEIDAAPFYVMAAYLAGGLVAFPVTLLIVGTAFVFNPWIALSYSLLGCILSAVMVHTIGRALGRQTVGRLIGPRLKRLNRLEAEGGVIAMAAFRLIPVAPYSIVNLAAGAAGVPLRDFILGTLIGMSPGVVGITFFGYQLEKVIRDPDPLGLAVLGGILLILIFAILWFRRWLVAKGPSQD